MSIQVEIISKESIKPSSPTPSHLRTFNFCLFDQIAPLAKIRILLFYDNNKTESLDIFRCRLKTSLSETLTSFYPIAGRINGNTSIECNDEGVDYVEARVKAQISDIIKHPDVDEVLNQLLPGDEPHLGELSKTLLAIQVNLFECGGIVISVCLSHKISDVCSMATFINSWDAKSCNSNQVIHPISQQLSSLFPPSGDLLGRGPSTPVQISKGNLVTKRFVFDSSQIASLRAEVTNSNGSSVTYPTRVELVSALIWRRFMELIQKKDEYIKECAAIHVVNFRNRMVPLLQGTVDALGNLYGCTFTSSQELASKNELYVLVGKLRDAIRKIDGEFVRKLQHGGDYIQYLRDEFDKGISTGKTGMILFTSWCRFPWYNADFGWGRPIWVTTTPSPTTYKNAVLLMDTRSGDGIEALVRMLEEDMAKFEQDEELLAFVSSTHSVNC